MTEEPYSRSFGWEVRQCRDMLADLEELVALYENAPATWHGSHFDPAAGCPICKALAYLGHLLEDLREVLQHLEGKALSDLKPAGTLLTGKPTIH